MAVVRTGPRDASARHVQDIGAAAGHSGDGLASIGRVYAADVPDDAQASGVGPIRRRHETKAERRAREARDAVLVTHARRPVRPGPAMHLLRPKAATDHASRIRGAAISAAVSRARAAERRAQP